jgi:hypothetical protein
MIEPIVIAFPTAVKAGCDSEPSQYVRTRLNRFATFGAAVAFALVANVSGAAPLSYMEPML